MMRRVGEQPEVSLVLRGRGFDVDVPADRDSGSSTDIGVLPLAIEATAGQGAGGTRNAESPLSEALDFVAAYGTGNQPGCSPQNTTWTGQESSR